MALWKMPPRPIPSLKNLLIWRMVLFVFSDPLFVTSYMCRTTSVMITSWKKILSVAFRWRYQIHFPFNESNCYQISLSLPEITVKKQNQFSFYLLLTVSRFSERRWMKGGGGGGGGVLRNDSFTLAFPAYLLLYFLLQQPTWFMLNRVLFVTVIISAVEPTSNLTAVNSYVTTSGTHPHRPSLKVPIENLHCNKSQEHRSTRGAF